MSLIARVFVAAAVILAVQTSLSAQDPAARYKEVATRLVAAVNAGDYEAVEREFNSQVQQALPLEKAREFFQSLSAQRGRIQELGPPRLIPPNQAIFLLRFERGALDMRIVLDSTGKIAGLWFAPSSPPIPAPERHETELRLPLIGRWMVFWGGDTKELNEHHDVPNQRFAFDLLGIGPEGKTRKGDGRVNEEYYAFAREILAPADGIVTEVIEGVRDNVPGSMNPYSALGNAVFIQHRQNEVSVLAHLKQGSIRVKVGERVKRGQVIGLCGNSGNSSEPHLHYHLQNTPVIQDGAGIKCYFEKVVVTREAKTETKTKYSPTKGDIVSPE